MDWANLLNHSSFLEGYQGGIHIQAPLPYTNLAVGLEADDPVMNRSEAEYYSRIVRDILTRLLVNNKNNKAWIKGIEGGLTSL